MSFIGELKRRNVVRMAVLYVVSSWLSLQVADVLFDALELPPQWVRLVVAVLILGFPVAVIFSWVYEMTPEGLRLEKDVERSDSITRETGRKINLLIVVLLVLALAVVAVDRLVPEVAPVAESPAIEGPAESAAPSQAGAVAEGVAPERSVAVLPFANRSAQDADGYFVDGIHDDILTQLARIGSLVVIARTSVEKFRGTSQSMKEVGAVLGVRNVLEGSVQRAGNRVRINAQLIDVTTDAHIWAETYDRELTTENIFAIQSDIASAIAEALKANLSPDEKVQLDSTPTENLHALEAYFRGRQAMAKLTAASLAEAERQFKQAVELDPNYALAYIGLADAYTLQSYHSNLPRDEQQKLAKPLIEKALAINDRLGEAYIALAEQEYADPEAREAQEALFKKGIELAPGYATGYQWYGEFLNWLGRPREALDQFNQAAHLDPLSSVIKVRAGEALEGLGRFDEARDQYESIIRTEPDFAPAYSALAALERYAYGRLDNAIVQVRKASAIDPGNPDYAAHLAVLWSDLGGDAEAAHWMDRVQSIVGIGPLSRFVALYINSNHSDLAGAAGHAAAIHAETPTDNWALRTLSLNDLHAGNGSAAVARYLEAYPALREDDVTIGSENFVVAADLAYALQATGDEVRANWLWDHSLDYLQTIPRLGLWGYQVMDVRIHAMQGNPEKALAALREAVDAGWRVSCRMVLGDPALAELRSEPEYQAIVALLEADMAAQLDRVRAIEANGELAPIAEDPAKRASNDPP